MTSARDAFWQRARHAVAEGNRAGQSGLRIIPSDYRPRRKYEAL
jgi:hypothetical protein